MPYSVGLDLGIASVGWSVIDTETGHIDDLGVRLFSARNSENNEERRNNRSSRRLGRRRRTRLEDAEKVLSAAGFVREEQDKHANPYELRVKGLHEKLSRSEINIVVKHILKKRGISYMEDASEEGASSEYKKSIQKNTQLLVHKTPGEIQLQRLNDKGRVRSGYNQLNEYQLNVFTVSDYAMELNRILETQTEFYPEMTEEFIQKFVDRKGGLVYRKRPYYEGPGNAANPSEYGRWKDYPVTGVPQVNIFDQLIGTDITGKLRASASSLSAQLYNLLNDLNNLTITSQDDPKLTTAQKQAVIDYLIYEDVTRFGAKDLAKLLGIDFADIKGWRLDSKDKPEVHSLKIYRDWRKIFLAQGVDLNDQPIELIDALAKIITLNTELEAIKETITLEKLEIDESIQEVVFNAFQTLKKKASSASWHAFSTDTLSLLIPELLNTSEEQNTVLERLKLKADFREKFAGLKHLPVRQVLEEIYNPTVSKTVSQAIRVLNAIVDRYGKENIAYVVIEMPRDRNEADQKKRIADGQKRANKQIEASNDYFMEQSNWPKAQFEAALKKPRFAKKLRYYHEQDGQCAYSGEPIEPHELLSDSVEIDHIIPLSISFDDSMKNKVLVKSKMNQAKGQRSPYGAFMDNAMLGRRWDDYVAWVKSKKYYKAKELTLLDTRNIYDPEVMQGFIARNLNDTRYASRVILNAVQSFFKNNEVKDSDKTTRVKVINGSYTSALRKRWGNALEKSRETHHHHAVDATLCAVSPFVETTPYDFKETDEGKMVYDEVEDEWISYHEFKKRKVELRYNYRVKWTDFIGQLVPTQLYPRIHFSHQVDRKWNRKVSDATIYSTRKVTKIEVKRGKEVEKEENLIIGKIKDIYTEDGWKTFDKYKDKLLMKEHDPQTYAILMDIVENYKPHKENQLENGDVKRVKMSPFKRYCEENGIPGVRKYAKKGNGPIIRSVKYYDKQIGSHINITKNEKGKLIEETSNRKNVALLQLTPWRTDVYYHSETDRFHLMGIKYNHLRFINGEYGIPRETYEAVKQTEKVPETAEFCFSLYRRDLIRIESDGEILESLYHSRTNAAPNYCEIKPIHKTKWDKNESIPVYKTTGNSQQLQKGIRPGMKLTKLNTDYLGKTYAVHQEELKNIIDENA